MKYNWHITGKKNYFYNEAGWFKGEEFVLIRIELVNIMPEIQMTIIFKIQVAKLVFSIGVASK